MIDLLVSLIGIIVGLAGSIFGYLQRQQAVARDREKTTMEIRLAEIEAQREARRGDDAATAAILAIMNTFIQALPQLQTSIENLVMVTAKQAEMISNLTQSTAAMAATSQDIVQKADEMHQVIERRDREFQQDRETQTARHEEITVRLDTQETQTRLLLDTLRSIEALLNRRADTIEALLSDSTSAEQMGTLLTLLQEKLAALHVVVLELIDITKEGRNPPPGDTPRPEPGETRTAPEPDGAHETSEEINPNDFE